MSTDPSRNQQPPENSQQQGFSLIELLVVLLIIGISFGFAILAFGDFGQERRISQAAEQFVYSLQLAQQQAILESATLGLALKNNCYQIYRFQEPAQWQSLANKGPFKPRCFPPHSWLHLKPLGGNQNKGIHILINASGDLTPFELQVGSSPQKIIKTLFGRHDGYLYTQTSSKT